MRLLTGILILCLILPSVTAVCTYTNTPQLTLSPATGEVALNEQLTGQLLLENDIPGTIIGYDFLTEELETFTLDGNAFTLHPQETDLELVRILFYAVAEECTATAVGEYNILYPPELSVTPTKSSIVLTEGAQQIFTATSSVPLLWELDGEQLDITEEFLYSPTFADAGRHQLAVQATNERGLTSTHIWSLHVQDVNRPPVQIARFPKIEIPVNGTFSLNLSNYFYDPDRGPLEYTMQQQAISGGFILPAELNPRIEGEFLEVSPSSVGKAFYAFTATDNGGANVVGDVVEFEVIQKRLQSTLPFCGDDICLAPESCDSCRQDCGECADHTCTPEWECTEWDLCSIAGYQYRDCAIVNDCYENATTPPESQLCEYIPTCDDGVQNGLEAGVDCGGECDACPTCSDEILNQGEEDVDCGGPCAACPRCDDGLLNGGESDVDCGGDCDPCLVGSTCTDWTDCLSQSCDGVCLQPSCTDGVVNQGEDDIDCGGPCKACPTCTDGMQNGEERGIDCGGSCTACPNCHDSIKNQDEFLVDCGGACNSCGLRDYALLLFSWSQWVLGALLSLFVIYIIRSIIVSRMLYLFTHGKAIHFFYEDDLTYDMVRWWNALVRHLRFSRHPSMREQATLTLQALLALRGKPESVVRESLIAELRKAFSIMLDVAQDFDFDFLVLEIRKAKLSFPIRAILLKNTKILYILQRTQLYTDAGFALQEAITAMDQLQKAF